jgi:hypothetical protein
VGIGIERIMGANGSGSGAVPQGRRAASANVEERGQRGYERDERVNPLPGKRQAPSGSLTLAERGFNGSLRQLHTAGIASG